VLGQEAVVDRAVAARHSSTLAALAALEEVQMAPPSRPVKALMAAEEFM
jgi:hypothetical protein